jgi:hypothetical protein
VDVIMSDPSDTSRWTLAIHRVSPTSVELWFGTLFPSMAMPEKARIRVIDAAGKLRVSQFTADKWKRPFDKVPQRFFITRTIAGLEPSSSYTVAFDRQVQENGKTRWQELRTGVFDTLPARIPGVNERPLTIGLGSCFYEHRDGGAAAEAYKLLFEHGDPKVRPHMKFLTGDQVYLDIGFDSLSPVTRELRERIADDYAKHWRSLGSILSRGGTWMLPDDHEYWNDYPYTDSAVPTLAALKIAAIRNAWKEAATNGVKNVQRSAVVETIDFGGDLSICLADLRSYRGVHAGEKVMMHPDSFPKLLAWAKRLQTPGVLVIAQPLVVGKESERNLLSFPGQYRQLIEALGQSGHDVVILTGDVHYGRIAVCPLGPKGGRLIEIIASPLSNLTLVNSISTSGPMLEPKRFPDRSVAIAGWAQEPVTYDPAFTVPSLPGNLFSPYVQTRTKEHFMTVSFARTAGDRVQLSAQSWLVREREPNTNLPKKGFAKEFSVVLA